MQARRIDLTTQFHKAIRRELFGVSSLAGSTDAANERELELLRTAAESLFSLLREHAAFEERHVLPLLVRHLPMAWRAVAADHQEGEPILRELERQLSFLGVGEVDERRTALQAFYRSFNLFLARQLQHLAEEEAIFARLQAHCSDGELQSMLGGFRASFTLGSLAESLSLLLPAIDPVERAGLLALVATPRPMAIAAGSAETRV